MIREITLKVNGFDFSGHLSTYSVDPELSYAAELTSINGTEIKGQKRYRDIVSFSMLPGTPDFIRACRDALRTKNLIVEYSDPSSVFNTKEAEMSLVTDLSSQFLLNSSDGNIYYKGGEIALRARRTY